MFFEKIVKVDSKNFTSVVKIRNDYFNLVKTFIVFVRERLIYQYKIF